MKKKNLPENCISMEEYKKRKPKPGVFNFNGFMKRPDEDLTAKVKESMKQNLKRDISETEAKNYIRIIQSLQTARLSKYKPKKKLVYKRKLFRLDDISADSKDCKTLRDWNFYWNEIKDGRIMASAGDIYNALKELQMYKKCDDKERSGLARSILKSLYSDMFNGGLITSTRVDFEILKKKPSLHANVTNHYGCHYRNEISRKRVFVPYTSLNVSISDFCNKLKGLDYLQCIFTTEDKAEEIVSNISLAFALPMEKIRIFTGKEERRQKLPHRVIKFMMNKQTLYIATMDLQSQGRSRGYLDI